MENELKSLSKVIENPEKPCVFILGGAKGDDSLKISKYVLDNNIADFVLTGGVTGQLFLASKEIDLGKPNMKFLEERGLMELTQGIKELMVKYQGKIKVPVDVAVEVNGKRREISVKDLPTNYSILDIGVKTARMYGKILSKAKSVVISGPMGVYEKSEFLLGTKKILEEIAASKAFSLVGGGHTIAAVEQLGLTSKMSYISTAGGALIEFLMGEKLPGVIALEEAAKRR
jgi:phosphoglycerate kinase